MESASRLSVSGEEIFSPRNLWAQWCGRSISLVLFGKSASALPRLAWPRQRAEQVRCIRVGLELAANNGNGVLRYSLGRHPRSLSACRDEPYLFRAVIVVR